MTKIINGRVAPLKTTIKPKFFNLKYFNAVLFVGIFGLGIFYLILINDLTVQGFALQNLSSRAANLASLNMNIQEEVNVAQSYPSLEARVSNLHLVAVNNVKYLSAHDLVVAKR